MAPLHARESTQLRSGVASPAVCVGSKACGRRPLCRSHRSRHASVRIHAAWHKQPQPSRDTRAHSATAVQAPAVDSGLKRSVQPLPSADVDLVQQFARLSQLASHVDTVTPADLAELSLELVATSTSGNHLAHLLGSTSDDEYEGGDGMAMPLEEVVRTVEQLGGPNHSLAQGWIPAMPPGSSAGASSRSRIRSGAALDELNARRDYDRLASSETESVMSRVQSLGTQISATAAKAVAAGRPLANKVQQPISKAAAQAATATGKAAAATLAAMQDAMAAKLPTASELVSATDSYDEFPEEGAIAPMGVDPATFSMASVRQLLKHRDGGAAAAGLRSPVSKFPTLQEPASRWLVADDVRSGIRTLVIEAPAELVKSSSRLVSSDLVTFESYGLGAKINTKLYQEASALYNRFMPLLLDYLEENPSGRVQLVGAGLGGALASVLALMLVHRGLRHHALAPVYALNAPAVLCEVPDFKQWCSKDGCSLEDVGGMLEDMMTRGVLAELGLPQDAIRNVYYPMGAGAAASEGATATFLGSNSVLTAAWTGNAIPEAIKAWVKGEAAAAVAGSGSSSASASAAAVNATLKKLPTQILHPLGKVLVYTGLSK